MQQHMGQIEEELRMTKEELGVAQKERDRALVELREMKIAAHEAITVKSSLSKSKQELNTKERNIELLKVELEKAKQFEVRLAEKDVLFDKLKEELSNSKASEARAMGLLSESKKKVQELEDEVARGKMSESRMFDSVVSQTKLLEQTKIDLEESKLEVASLREKVDKFQVSPNGNLDSTKENLVRAQEGEKVASSKAKSLLEEMNLLKNELKLAFEAEEKSKKAMDDLALALKEVATEANQAKEKLISTELELEHIKQEGEQLKVMVRSTEDKYMRLLDEAKKETEQHKNTVERLRLEAEESLLAWNDKEMGFVDCIKIAEDEKTLAQQENIRLIEALKAAENITRASREENFKLRDILKQALNEANVAKEAAGIARDENSQLKDCQAEKDEALEFLARENERLRINEAAANESIKELKRLLSKKESNNRGGSFRTRNSIVEELEGGKNMNKAFSFDLSELKIPYENEDVVEKVVDEDPVKDEALRGSIFDIVDSPRSETHTPLHGRSSSSSLTDGGEVINSKDLDHVEGSRIGDADNDRNSQRKRRALLQRFGDLLRRKS